MAFQHEAGERRAPSPPPESRDCQSPRCGEGGGGEGRRARALLRPSRCLPGSGAPPKAKTRRRLQPRHGSHNQADEASRRRPKSRNFSGFLPCLSFPSAGGPRSSHEGGARARSARSVKCSRNSPAPQTACQVESREGRHIQRRSAPAREPSPSRPLISLWLQPQEPPRGSEDDDDDDKEGGRVGKGGKRGRCSCWPPER